MKRIIVFLFGTKVARLQKRSAATFNVFKSTVESLSSINDRIASHKLVKQAEIERAQAEHSALHEQQESNQKTIDKINEFFK